VTCKTPSRYSPCWKPCRWARACWQLESGCSHRFTVFLRFLIEYGERLEGLLQKSNSPAALLLEHFQSMMCHTGKHSQSIMCHTGKHLNSTMRHTGKHLQSIKCHTAKHLQSMMCHTGKHGVRRTLSGLSYGVATISRLLKIVGLFGKRAF